MYSVLESLHLFDSKQEAPSATQNSIIYCSSSYSGSCTHARGPAYFGSIAVTSTSMAMFGHAS
jgi:hypothetical protein